MKNAIKAVEPDADKAKEPDFGEYEVKDAADTIMRAEEHKQNPKLMKHVQKHLSKKMKAIKSVQDIRDVYQDKFGDK